VLTCGHVLQDSDQLEVISRKGSMSARILKVDNSLDLALLELAQPISAPEPQFTDFPLQKRMVLRAVGVQENPGKPEELSVAETELKYRNKNDADGKILDIQFEGGARPGYSGGPVVTKKGRAWRCVGIMRLGGLGANLSNAIGLASIRAFVPEYISEPEENSRPNRLLILTAILFGVLVFGAIAKRHYVAPPSPKIVSGTGGISTPKPRGPVQIPPEPTRPQEVKVWVNTPSNVYHCPGTRLYGKTKHGKYMTQAEARKEGSRPAYGKVCK
jgi:hypothetical protein